MTKKEVEELIKEERLIYAYNLLENRPDRENEVVVKTEDNHYIVYQTDEHAQMPGHPVKIISEQDALDIFLSKLRAIKTKHYEQLFSSNDATRVLRENINKTFISSHEFEASYHELYKSKGGRYFSVLRIDPAPGGYGEEYMYIKEAYKLDIDANENSYSDEELLQLVFSKGEKI